MIKAITHIAFFQITLLNLPATDGESSSTVLYELSSSSSACPKDICKNKLHQI